MQAKPITISDVSLGETKEYGCGKSTYADTAVGCPGSIGYLPIRGDGSLYVLSFGFTETGKVGIDFDAAKAEIEALKAAVGPALAEGVKALLD